MNEEEPRILYKYRDWTNDFHQRLLTEGEIYFPSFNQLNDPFDGAIPFRYPPEQLTPENMFLKMREITRYEHPDWNEQQIHEYNFDFHQKELYRDDRHWAEMQEETKQEANQKFGVLSLAKRCDNYLLWSYYSNAHSGFCIGLNVEALRQHLKGTTLGAIVYQDDLPLIDLFGDHNEMVLKWFFTKGSHWCHEEEYRIVQAYQIGSTNTISSAAIHCVFFNSTPRSFLMHDYCKICFERSSFLSDTPERFSTCIYRRIIALQSNAVHAIYIGGVVHGQRQR